MATPAAASSTAPTRTPYRVSLHWIECCNCGHGCGCQFAGLPDHGKCEFLIGWQVKEGRYGDVPLEGVRFVIGAMYPGAIHEGNGKVVLFVDERASQAQAEAITSIVTGQAGGMPWEALVGTVGSFEGPVRRPIEMTVNGTRSGFRVEGAAEVRQVPIKDAMSGADKEVQVHYPKGGFFWNTGNICTTEVMRCDHGAVRFEHPGGYACYSGATWTNQQ